MEKPVVIFVLGGPGSGKGTQCNLIQEKFGFFHISAGDCLREYLTKCEKKEVDDEYKLIVEDCINNGKIVPVHITVGLMKKKMESEIKNLKEKENNLNNKIVEDNVKQNQNQNFNSIPNNLNIEEYKKKLKYTNILENQEIINILNNIRLKEKPKYKFIIDGFPRNYDNFNGWVKYIGDYAHVLLCLFFYCDEQVMINRCIDRGIKSGRVDDNIETLRKRLETHKNDSLPIINLFLSEKRCIFINANQNIEDVWKDIQYIFSNF